MHPYVLCAICKHNTNFPTYTIYQSLHINRRYIEKLAWVLAIKTLTKY